MKQSEGELVLAKIWVSAYRLGEQGEGLPLDFPDKATKVQARFALYNLAKAVKRNPQRFTAELAQAVENCAITQEGDTRLIVRAKRLQPMMQAMLEQLPVGILAPTGEMAGLGLVADKSQEELEAEASYERLMRAHGNKETGMLERASNPYYSRDKGE